MKHVIAREPVTWTDKADSFCRILTSSNVVLQSLPDVAVDVATRPLVALLSLQHVVAASTLRPDVS